MELQILVTGASPHFDSKLSMADTVEMDEMDEEFDGMPSTRSPEVVWLRYDKLRAIGARVQCHNRTFDGNGLAIVRYSLSNDK